MMVNGAEISERNLEEFAVLCGDAISRVGKESNIAYELNYAMKKLKKFFEQPLDTFSDSGLRKLNKKIGGRKAFLWWERRRVFCDLLLIDQEGYCYTVEEAATPALIFNDDEIFEFCRIIKEQRDENFIESDDWEAEEAA